MRKSSPAKKSIAKTPSKDELTGLVIQRAGDRLIVNTDAGLFLCSGRKRFRYFHETTGGVLVGDNVSITVTDTYPEKTASGVVGEGGIRSVVERRNAFLRGDPFNPSQPMGIAANIDRIIVIGAVYEPSTSFGLIDRLLVGAEASGVEKIVLVWNKIDLLEDGEKFVKSDFYQEYQSIGYPVIGVSAATGAVSPLLKNIESGRSLLLGASGVGKSTLLNCLIPGLQLTTNPISEATGKGVHTTTVARMLTLPSGAEIIDTPGVRSLTLVGITNEYVQFFPEFREFMGKCKYSNCSHIDDAGCAIRAAMDAGVIREFRYNSFRDLTLNES
ncbi:MAG: ribosome small subunit-dependent GTPase A [bacterium]|nr:ribosome small subunit-dependent GTPase A [bacterium]